jgi:hypothetical protein|tara:strand:- start:326 stop:496 length:171 start_codon:yes stop_codon:yes gene_type:complete
LLEKSRQSQLANGQPPNFSQGIHRKFSKIFEKFQKVLKKIEKKIEKFSENLVNFNM